MLNCGKLFITFCFNSFTVKEYKKEMRKKYRKKMKKRNNLLKHKD